MKFIRNTGGRCHLLPKSCAPYLLYTYVYSKWCDISFNFIIKLEDLRIRRFYNETTIYFKWSLLRGKVIEYIKFTQHIMMLYH